MATVARMLRIVSTLHRIPFVRERAGALGHALINAVIQHGLDGNEASFAPSDRLSNTAVISEGR